MTRTQISSPYITSPAELRDLVAAFDDVIAEQENR